MNSIPVTVLTGYLGSGKTTLLNRILQENHGHRIAVIENEFGEIGIDHDLVIGADEEIFEMNNGCICCTVRGDLIRILGHLLKRKTRFDRILIETTGLADPGPVIQTFFLDDDLKNNLHLDAVVTLADAKHLSLHLGSQPEAAEQLAFADVILLNKTDLVPSDQLPVLQQQIRTINALAPIHPAVRAEIPLNHVLDIGGFDLNRILQTEPDFLDPHHLEHHHHHHQPEITSVGLTTPGNLDPEKLNHWIGELLRTKGPDLFRLKGILSIAGRPERYVLQGVHMILDGRLDRPWGKAPRTNTLVFIGKNLDRDALQRGLHSCLVA